MKVKLVLLPGQLPALLKLLALTDTIVLNTRTTQPCLNALQASRETEEVQEAGNSVLPVLLANSAQEALLQK